MGVARTIGAVSFSVIIGLSMALIYRNEEKVKKEQQYEYCFPPESADVANMLFTFLLLF
jgi:hypothetical protein